MCWYPGMISSKAAWEVWPIVLGRRRHGAFVGLDIRHISLEMTRRAFRVESQSRDTGNR
jgi:hypothetical protein